MPPTITIIRPPKPVTEEEQRLNQKCLDEINNVLTEIAYKYCYVQSDERKIAQ